MKPTELRTLIKESIQEYIREVETSGNIAAQEAKIRACEEAIALREKKTKMEGLDEAYHDMIDEAKKKNLEKEIKELQKYKTKAEKLLEKMKAKAEGKTSSKQTKDEDTMDEVIDEVDIDETFPESGAQLEEDQLDEAKKKMTAAQKGKKEDIVKGMKKSKSFGKSKEEKAKMYATSTKLATKESVKNLNENKTMNKQFLHMQKLAGLITETQYKQKLNENISDLKVEWTPEYYEAIKNYGDEAYDEKGLVNGFQMRDGKKVKEIIGYYVPENAELESDEEFDIIGYIYSTTKKDIESYSEEELDRAFEEALRV